MERRIETRIEWDFKDDMTSAGMTDLPLPKKRGQRPRLLSMTASSSVTNPVFGYLQARLDRSLDRSLGGLAVGSPMARRLRRMHDSWGSDAQSRSALWVDVDKAISAEFRVADRRKPFCDVAIERALQLFELLGVNVAHLPHPLVVQETYVRAARQPGGLKDWIPYGEWLWQKRCPVTESRMDNYGGRGMP